MVFSIVLVCIGIFLFIAASNVNMAAIVAGLVMLFAVLAVKKWFSEK